LLRMTDKTSVAASNNPWNRGPLRVKTPNELDDECPPKFNSKNQREFPVLGGQSGGSLGLFGQNDNCKEQESGSLNGSNKTELKENSGLISQDDHMSQDGDAQESGSSVDDKSVSSNDVKSEIVDETAKTSAANGAFPTKQELLDDDELDWDFDEMPEPEATRNTGFKSSRASSESSQPPNKKVRGSYNLSFKHRGSNRRNVYIPEVETDPKTLARREQQIEYGKVTDDYAAYISEVAKADRVKGQPVTPRKDQVISRRNFDNQIRKWKKQIHFWRDIDRCIAIKSEHRLSKGASKRESPKKDSVELPHSSNREEPFPQPALHQLDGEDVQQEQQE